MNDYRLQARFRVDMHGISICARRDLEKTWVLGHFHITREEFKAIMTDWKDEWKHNVPQEEVSGSEDEEIDTNKQKEEEADEDVEVVKEKKPVPKKTKKTMRMKRQMTETIEDPEVIEKTRTQAAGK